MRRNNLFRTIIIAVSLVWGAYELYPTFRLTQIKKQAQEKTATLAKMSELPLETIQDALNRAALDATLQEELDGRSQDSLQAVLQGAKSLTELHEQVVKLEPEAIRLGLDLQGGTYLVYEVDLVKMFVDQAKNKDQRLNELMARVQQAIRQPNVDFFDVLKSTFEDADIRLSRYWGSRAETDAKILDDLRKEAEDGVDRNLEILRNRIDQFGVSEPSITKQGDRRIVVELAGIQSVDRAKGVIGKTALLEFKLEKDPEVTQDVLAKIDTWMKGSLRTGALPLTADSTQVDTARKESEAPIHELFGTSVVVGDSGKAANDSSVLIDEGVLKDNPFYSLLRRSGRGVSVPKQNYRAVERILNTPAVQEIMRNADAQFLWSSRTFSEDDFEYYVLYLTKREAELTGDKIADARPDIGGGSSLTSAGQPIVNMRMNAEGTKIFSRITGANVNKNMSIVLDNRVASSPRINERIPSGSAYIEGMKDFEEAKDLSTVLRAGALRAPMEVIEERTVGPSLGQDSITQGTRAALIGLALVILFMAVYYKLSGVLADIALIVNLFLLMSFMAVFKATLTLPGIAGIILTIGMAVDANVLIFERIREELRSKKTVLLAIKEGYDRAFWTIFDANITTILTALVLYQFGTGPIRGFAVTLIFGIAVSMFTAIVMTRVVYDFVSTRWTLKTLSI
jgi:preprotein translocase subunit SecD